ncbi:MAG: hypothetical protein GTN36_05890 [Candidatus Aenigmarchaeota archaeon]|nr:hypothetical protein [Candidatus Aenigmarchaeota archaeon]
MTNISEKLYRIPVEEKDFTKEYKPEAEDAGFVAARVFTRKPFFRLVSVTYQLSHPLTETSKKELDSIKQNIENKKIIFGRDIDGADKYCGWCDMERGKAGFFGWSELDSKTAGFKENLHLPAIQVGTTNLPLEKTRAVVDKVERILMMNRVYHEIDPSRLGKVPQKALRKNKE